MGRFFFGYLLLQFQEVTYIHYISMKTKLDARLEAARLTIDSEAEDFTKKATEIYDFLVKGIELPDREEIIDPMGIMKDCIGKMSALKTDIHEKEEGKSEQGEA